MTKKVLGALLIVVLIAGAAFVYKYVEPLLKDKQQADTSDAGGIKGEIRLALDNWVGYFILRSPEMKNRMRRAQWRLDIEDDNADYARRMQRLNDGELDFAVVTVDSYLLNAAQYDYPGTIVLVIDESKGGDAILARADRADSIDALKGKLDLKVAFTPGSPSHHLAKAASDHFAVPELLPPPGDSRRIETMGSEEAVKKLLSGAADVAVAWEPDVSRALARNGVVKILGTEDTEKLIVDILVVNRGFARKNPDVVHLLLATYFQVLKHYREDTAALIRDVKAETGLSGEVVESMLQGVEWVTLMQNCEQWFGISAPGTISYDGLASAIESTVAILVNAGDFSGDPLPNGDPYRLINSDYLEQLFTTGVSGFTTGPETAAIDSLEAKFSPLGEDQWKKLKEVATLKVDPIIFQAGSSELDSLAKNVVDSAVERLRHYPNFRIEIRGHTSDQGDPEANTALSQDRADAVARYLRVVYNVDANRLRSVGLGGSKPLLKEPGESDRAWRYRLPRVEIVLVREEY